jgi:hypothetical protein
VNSKTKTYLLFGVLVLFLIAAIVYLGAISGQMIALAIEWNKPLRDISIDESIGVIGLLYLIKRIVE